MSINFAITPEASVHVSDIWDEQYRRCLRGEPENARPVVMSSTQADGMLHHESTACFFNVPNGVEFVPNLSDIEKLLMAGTRILVDDRHRRRPDGSFTPLTEDEYREEPLRP